MGNRLFLTLEQAIDVLPEKEQIHCFINGNFRLVGADWDKEKVKEALSNSNSVEIGGEQCKALGHALVCVPKGAKYQSDIYFFESDKEKVEYYEKLLEEKENLERTLEESAEIIREQDTKWQKLKEWLEKKKSWNERQLKEAHINTEFYIRVSVQGITINKILDKMSELEAEDEN